MQDHKINKISIDEKNRLINSQQVKLYHGIWHYSFNEIFQRPYYRISDGQGRMNIVSGAMDSWSPVIMYSNYEGSPLFETNNLIVAEYDKDDPSVTTVFWYLSLTSFNDFLKRRDQISAHPRKSYPSTKTYNAISAQMNYEFYYDKFNNEKFVKYYDELRNPEHQSADAVLSHLTEGAYQVPKDWLRMAYLTHNNEMVTAAVLVDDSKSICVFNISTKRSKHGYGIVFFTELIKYACEHKYCSLNGGVSDKYGVYKDKLFLDSKLVFQGADLFRDPYLLNPSLKYMRNIVHMVKHIYKKCRVR